MTIYYSYSFNNKNGESHCLLARAVSDYLEIELEQAETMIEGMHSCTEFGKPVIDGFSDFSISHNDNCWAVLIEDSACGLDVQYEKDSNFKTVSSRYYTEEEKKLVEELGAAGFFRLWARREALVKTVGTTIVNSSLPSVVGETVEFEGSLWQLKDLELPGAEKGLHAACCIAAAADIGELRYVELR